MPVPAGYHQQRIDFSDPLRGYALYNRCDRARPGSCSALLLATVDGGRSWKRLRHPRPEAAFHDLVVWDEWLLLTAEPHQYVSTDEGLTFVEVSSSFPLFHRYAMDTDGRIVESIDDEFRVLTLPPGVEPVTVAGYHGTALLVVGLRDGETRVLLSEDNGASWEEASLSGIDPRIDGWVGQLSVDGDAWLLGYHGAEYGRPPAQVWHRVGGPGSAWLPVPVEEFPELLSGTAAAGAGTLVVTGLSGIGVIDRQGRYHDPGWPVSASRQIKVLSDGTLFTVYAGGAWLGDGAGARRTWTKIVLHRV